MSKKVKTFYLENFQILNNIFQEKSCSINGISFMNIIGDGSMGIDIEKHEKPRTGIYYIFEIRTIDRSIG